MKHKSNEYQVKPQYLEEIKKICNLAYSTWNGKFSIYSDIGKKIKDLNLLEVWCTPIHKKNIYFDLNKLRVDTSNKLNCGIFTYQSSKDAGFVNEDFILLRDDGFYKNKAFYLNIDYNWEIKRDELNNLVLIPSKK